MKYLSVQTFQCGISVSGAATFTGGATINLLALNGATTSSEASLFLGAHGTNEGGQLVLQKGTSNTYAAHLDNYADQFRILYGTNTGSTGVALAVSLSTRQLILPAYTSTSSFSGTVVGYLAFDSSGNVLTTPVPAGGVTSIIAGTGVTVSSGTGNVTVSIGQSVATSASPSFDSILLTNNGNGTNIKVGDDAYIGDVNVANSFRVMGAQNGANGYIIFGNANFDALGRSGTGNLTYAGSTVWTAATLTDLSQLTNGPGYITSAALSGYVPTSRTLTINGTTYDLSANRTWTISTVDYTSRLQHQVKAGVAINKGQAVYVTSADGTNMIVGLASNASEATSSKTMGLLDATVAINGFANVVTEGLLAGLDTSAAGTEGDPVWLGTGGNLIYGLANKPSAPAHLVFIGIVTRKNLNNGEIFVKVQNGFELNEIHDVDLKTTVPVNGHILGFDGTLWVNKTIAGWLGYTPVSGTGTTNYLPKFTGSTSLGDSKFFDNGTTPSIYVNSLNATSRFYFSPVHADGRINLNAVAGTNDYTLLRAWHTGNTVGIGNGSTFGSALSTYYDSVLIGTSGAIYFMNGTFGPNNVPYRLGISTSATATYFSSGVSNNLTNIESNEFIFTAKAHTFYTGTTTGNQANPNQYTPLFLSTSGNVGIGTTGLVPGYLLTINGSVSITAGQSLSLDPSAGIYMVASSSQFRLYNNSIAALSVASTGNILINTTTDSGYKLDVNGTARIKGNVDITTSGGTNVLLAYSSYVQAWQSFYVSQGGGAHNFAVSNASSGGNAYFNNVNVGIGTTSPSQKLDVNGYAKFTSGIILDGGATSHYREFIWNTSGFNRWDLYVYGAEPGSNVGGDLFLARYADNGAYLANTVTFQRSTGNVGINTTSPYSKLEITSSSVAWGEGIVINPASGYSAIFYRLEGAQGSNYTGTWAVGKAFSGDGGGELLQVVKNGLTGSAAYRVDALQQWKTNGDSIFGFNVGIGTTNPLGKLHIADDGPNALRIGDTQVSTIGETNDGGYPGMKIVPYNSNIHIGISSTNDNKINLWHGGSNYTYWQQLSTYSVISNYSTNALVFQVNGGNVGIGTTSPTKKLHVASSANEGIFMEGTANGGHWFDFKSANSNLWSMGAQPGLMGWYNRSDGSYKMVITDGGSVGIGTTSPVSPLDVNGIISSRGIFIAQNSGTYNLIYNASNSVAMYIGGSADPATYYDNLYHYFRSNSGSTTYGVWNSTGLGIGTSSPGAKLHVVGASILANNSSINPDNYSNTVIAGAIGTVGGWGLSSAIGGNAGTGHSWAIGTNGDNLFMGYSNGSSSNSMLTFLQVDDSTRNVFLVPAAGNVGIGTTTPSYKLDINGALRATGTVYSDNGSLAGALNLGQVVSIGSSFGSYANLIFTMHNGGGFSDIMKLQGNGNVGIGTNSPTNRLQIGSIGSSGYGGNDLAIGNGTQVMAFYQSSTVSTWYTNTSFSLMPSGSGSVGNLGVGTDSPTQRVHVSGNLRVTGAFYDSNNQAGSAGQILKSTGSGTDWVSLSEITGVDGSGTANYVTKWSDADTVTNSLIYDNGTNVGIGTTSPGYNFDVNGQVRVQDKLRVGTVNSGNGVVHMSSSATINPNTTTIVWAQNVSVGMCAFIEYYILNNNSLTDQRAGTIMVTWNQSGTPTIAHTETTTPDIGSTTSINFTSSLVGADARINAVNSSANPYTIVMSYKYF